ncbi:MAG: LLM class flavin-dependent oxidoreductase [Dehalococcoidia bacterium]|nr:LLM class flavin-dependent oxidoreductase [Dehalococcoidia bacterium]MYD27399.1 LLM class flavin-dependent oxidoreductase [Dehalococcoidia bacterium]
MLKDLTIGSHVLAFDARSLIDGIVAADRAGLNTAWLVSGGTSADPLAVFAVAAGETEQIGFGTSIIPTFPRHPLAVVQGALVVEQLAPGRLKLGVGPSHKPGIEGMYGFEFTRPLQHLREYLTILKATLQEGSVSFHGERLHAEASLQPPPMAPTQPQQPVTTQVKVMASALRPNAYRLCGEVADGAISWVSPLHHLERVAVPALEEGARKAGRERPALVSHVPVVVSEDAEAVWAASQAQLGFYPNAPYYSAMWQDAGFPEAADGTFSRAMSDALVIQGSEQEVAERIRGLPSAGVNEMLAGVLNLEGDPSAADRTIELLGALAQEQ